MSPRLEFALNAAYLAGRSTLAHFNTNVAIERKADETPITVADREAEALIRAILAESYSGEGILGEEEGETGTNDSRWVIDPIDGTKSFICGVPLYATLLSFEEAGQPLLGVAYFPALDEVVYAERGKGAFWNGRPCRVSTIDKLEDATICAGSHASMAKYGRDRGFHDIAMASMTTRTWGDAYGYMLVATGRVEAMIDPVVNRWDISPVSLIVREAGGTFTTLDGGSELGNDSIGSNGLLHDRLLECFRA